MPYFDSHAHLDDQQFDEDREKMIKAILLENEAPFVTIGYSLESSQKAIALAKQYSIYATVGISPNDIPQTQDELWKQLQKIEEIVQTETKNQKRQNLLAIGEIGLDYYWNKENKELQQQAFIKQIELANQFDLPITIHTREAVSDTIAILKTNVVKEKGIFHCCPLNRELIKQALQLGFYISFAGPVTFKNSKHASEMINMVPFDKILIETDSPYLSPEPRRGRRNDPRNVKYIAQKIAEVKGLTITEVANQTYKNAKTIYKIKE